MGDVVKLTITWMSGTVLCVFAIASCTHGVNMADDTAMLEMIKHGADPIGAMCAVKGSAKSECTILSAKK